MTPREIDDYLREKQSPLAGKGAVFVREARKNGLDPRLLVAIAGAESQFGTQVKPGTNNPFGWGPHIPFPSWDRAIATVARGLRTGYLDEGRKTIAQIGEKWAPVGAGNDPTNLNSNWAKNVGRFYAELGGRGVPQKPSTPATVTQPPVVTGMPVLPTELPTAGPDLAGLALSNLSSLTGGQKPVSPMDMLNNLTMTVAAAPRSTTSPKLAASAPAPAPPSPAGAPAPQEPPSPAAGFVPEFKTALDRLIAASGGKVWVTSGFRSNERQAELFKAAVQKYGSEEAARKWVAPPGKSKHNHGVAADLGGDLAWVRANAARFGLYQPMSWEPWHWELKGSRG